MERAAERDLESPSLSFPLPFLLSHTENESARVCGVREWLAKRKRDQKEGVRNCALWCTGECLWVRTEHVNEAFISAHARINHVFVCGLRLLRGKAEVKTIFLLDSDSLKNINLLKMAVQAFLTFYPPALVFLVDSALRAEELQVNETTGPSGAREMSERWTNQSDFCPHHWPRPFHQVPEFLRSDWSVFMWPDEASAQVLKLEEKKK